ncbi:MAG: glycosyltransferase family 2 protein [Acidimicrobiales bacterium]
MRGARFALFFTAVAWFVYLVEQVDRLVTSELDLRTAVETGVYLVFVTLLALSAWSYLLARLGHYQRAGEHRRVPRSVIDDRFEERRPTMTVLVPSYREDERVIRQTLLSAALQEYPDLSVVLLIDDPPHPTDPAAIAGLEAARALPGRITELLEPQRRRFEAALDRFEHQRTSRTMADSATLTDLAGLYDEAAAWFDDQRAPEEWVDHTDEFLATAFLGRIATDLRTTAGALRDAAAEDTATVSRRRVHQLHRRLVHLFRAELSSFERKKFASLSHEANKAMNLNSYLALLGGRYRIAPSPGGDVLVPAGSADADLVVAAPDYLLTLDADSVLMPEYCLRLVDFMEQPDNADVAVVQTPYTAFPGAPTRIERIAGATTDIQHIVHQGLTHYGATFWVGANAVIRRRALEDLEQVDEEKGFVVRRFISDRTVIEDTESSIELRSRGWRLHNYPERLSYSATPPDFGSLCVQRQRWANGGLVILPSLLRQLRRRGDGPRMRPAELLLRANYLSSISWASLGLLLLLFYPFDDDLLSRTAVLVALPYFLAMSADLRRIGYRRSDILRVYGFNLLLLPVNLAGTIQSVVQGIGGQKIAFARTPKVRNRTVAPFLFVVLPFVLAIWSARTLLRDIDEEAWIHGAFAGLNLAMITYAVIAMVGLRHTLVDVVVNTRDFVWRPALPRTTGASVPNWATVLYVGGSDRDEIRAGASQAVALAAHDRTADELVLTSVLATGAVDIRARSGATHREAAIAGGVATTSAPTDVEVDLVDLVDVTNRADNERGGAL